jgi:5-methylcytosine-specific restriction endonuclease McrA
MDAAYYRDWRRRNPEYVRAHREQNLVREANRRARLVGAPGAFTLAEWERLCFEHCYVCAYCGAWTTLTADHRISLLRGGTNTIDNILPACASCNSRKGTMSEEEFRRMLGWTPKLGEPGAPYVFAAAVAERHPIRGNSVELVCA